MWRESVRLWSQLCAWEFAALKTLPATARHINISISFVASLQFWDAAVLNLDLPPFLRLRVSWPWRHHVDTGGTSHTGSWIISWSRWLLLMPEVAFCLDTVLLLSARDIEDTLKPRKGRDGAFSDWRAGDWTGKRLTARSLGLFSATAEELAPKAWTSAETRKKNSKKTTDVACSPLFEPCLPVAVILNHFTPNFIFFPRTRCYCYDIYIFLNLYFWIVGQGL